MRICRHPIAPGFRTWKRADSPSASKQRFTNRNDPKGRLLFTLCLRGFLYGPTIIGMQRYGFFIKYDCLAVVFRIIYVYLTFQPVSREGSLLFVSFLPDYYQTISDR